MGIRNAIGFLTILPVGAIPSAKTVVAGCWLWPLIGAILGLISGIVFIAGSRFEIYPPIALLLALIVLIVLTGAMHEDGLADAADGLLGGRDPESRLSIMKDSCVGTFGVIALTLTLLARWQGLSGAQVPTNVVFVLIVACTLSRAAMLVCMFAIRPARDTGLSAALGRPSVFAVAAGCAIAIMITWWFLGGNTLPVLFVAGLVGLSVSLLVYFRIRGQTGDTLGATQQCVETACIVYLGLIY